MALSNRSKLYLRKLKAQQGLQVPYIDPSSNDMFRDYYSISAPNNVTNMQNIQPNLQAAKQATIIRDNPETRGKVGLNMYSKNNSVNIPSMNVPTSKGQYVGGGYGENDATDFADSVGESGLPFLSGWFTSVNGIRDMIYSYEDEERQKAYEKSTREDLKQRKDQARANNFYFTPYTTGRTYKHGGKVKYQNGGVTNSIDTFMNYYNKQQDASKQSLDSLEEYYRSKNNFMRDQWNARRTKGLSNHIMGGIDSFMDYWTYGADGQSMNAGTLDEAQASLDTGQNPTAMGMQKGGYLPTVTNDSGIISTATSVLPLSVDTSETLQRLENQRQLDNIDINIKRAQWLQTVDPAQRDYFTKVQYGADPEKTNYGKHLRKKDRYREKQEGGEIYPEPYKPFVSIKDNLYFDPYNKNFVERNDKTGGYKKSKQSDFVDKKGIITNGSVKIDSNKFKKEIEKKHVSPESVFGEGNRYATQEELKDFNLRYNKNLTNPTDLVVGNSKIKVSTSEGLEKVKSKYFTFKGEKPGTTYMDFPRLNKVSPNEHAELMVAASTTAPSYFKAQSDAILKTPIKKGVRREMFETAEPPYGRYKPGTNYIALREDVYDNKIQNEADRKDVVAHEARHLNDLNFTGVPKMSTKDFNNIDYLQLGHNRLAINAELAAHNTSLRSYLYQNNPNFNDVAGNISIDDAMWLFNQKGDTAVDRMKKTYGNPEKMVEYMNKYQEGGLLPQDDLYSEQFQSPYQQDEQESEQLQNKVYADNPGMSFENNKGLFEWLFGEEPVETHTISDIYDSQYSNNNENVSFIGGESGTEIPIKPLVDQFTNIGINIGSVNTGQHNVGSKHYIGKAFDIPASKNEGKEGLYKIYNYLNSAEGKKQFPNIKIINEIEAPAGKVGTGNHLHIELI